MCNKTIVFNSLVRFPSPRLVKHFELVAAEAQDTINNSSFELTAYKQGFTFSHEGALAMVQDLLCNEAVVNHLVVFHVAEGAVFHKAVELLFHQRALQERADPLYGSK